MLFSCSWGWFCIIVIGVVILFGRDFCFSKFWGYFLDLGLGVLFWGYWVLVAWVFGILFLVRLVGRGLLVDSCFGIDLAFWFIYFLI